MPPRKPSAADLLDLLISKAPALHAAGITAVTVDGISATLKPPPPPASEPPRRAKGQPEDDAAPPPPHMDPLQDAASYGAGRVPGFPRPTKD